MAQATKHERFRTTYTLTVEGIIAAETLIHASEAYGLNAHMLETVIRKAKSKLQLIHPDHIDSQVPTDPQISIILKVNPRVHKELLLVLKVLTALFGEYIDRVRHRVDMEEAGLSDNDVQPRARWCTIL